MKLNISAYLKILFPNRRIGYSKEAFLTDFFTPIIEDFDIKNKLNEDYIITKELTSNLVRNKVDLPNCLKTALEKACDNPNKYEPELNRLFKYFFNKENFQEYSEKLYKTILDYKPFKNTSNNELINLYLSKNLTTFHLKLFYFASLEPNRHNYSSIRKPGRPAANENVKEFFYLSEEEKKKEFSRMIKKFSRENAKISMNEFRYFLDSLPYCNYTISKNVKNKIIFNFLPVVQKSDTSVAQNLIDYFEMALMTFGKVDLFKEWINLVPDQAAKYVSMKLEKEFEELKTSNDFEKIENYLKAHVDNDFILKNQTFKMLWIKNNFFLPDFFYSINREIWSYCLFVCSLVYKAGLADDFVSYIDSIYQSSSKNNTITERCEYLKIRAGGNI